MESHRRDPGADCHWVLILRTFASKIIDTFQIEDRGTAILLALPIEANLAVSIGDAIHVNSVNGQWSSCEVLGIEMARGLPPHKCGLAILVRPGLLTTEYLRGDSVWIERPTVEQFSIAALFHTSSNLHTIFAADQSGHLLLGHSSRSVTPASTEELHKGAIEFQDYIMEGFVRYLVSVEQTDDTIELNVGLIGSNRDRYVRPHLEFQLRSLTKTKEASNDLMDRSGGSTAY